VVGLLLFSKHALTSNAQERRSAELADYAVSPSAFLVDWLRRMQHWNLSDAHTLVHQNIINDVPLQQQQESSSVARMLKGDDVVEFVFFGRLETRKGVLMLADAFDELHARTDEASDAMRARLRSVTLTFLGKDPQLLSETLQKRCALWRDAPRCRFELNQDRDTALLYLQQSGRVAIVPSLTENSPYTVMECAQLGVALLAARVGGIPELLDTATKARFVPFALLRSPCIVVTIHDSTTQNSNRHCSSRTHAIWPIRFGVRCATAFDTRRWRSIPTSHVAFGCSFTITSRRSPPRRRSMPIAATTATTTICSSSDTRTTRHRSSSA
jgi:hypothetical protein